MQVVSLKCEVFILAGGLSTRMGRDKSGMRLGAWTMLEHVKASAQATGARVRVIRRDAVARCGPLGGIYTGLKRSRAELVMFLACDMPFVTGKLLEEMLTSFHKTAETSNIELEKGPSPLAGQGRKMNGLPSSMEIPAGIFASEDGRAGFPCVLRRNAALKIVCAQIEIGEFSLQALAKKLRAKVIRPSRSPALQMSNINTPAELKKAQSLLKLSLSNARRTAKVGRC